MILFNSYLLLLFTLVLSDLTVKPEDITAFTGDKVTFKCSTSSQHGVQWMCEGNCSSTPGTQRILFLHGKLMELQNKRIEVNTSVTGQYDLMISSVSESDAGTYSCLDLDEPEFIASAILLVKSVTITSTPVFSESQATTDPDNKPGSAFVVVIVVVIVAIVVVVIITVVIVYLCQRKQVDSPDSANINAQETKRFLNHPPDTESRCIGNNDTQDAETSQLPSPAKQLQHQTSVLSNISDELQLTVDCYSHFLEFARNQKLDDTVVLADTTLLNDEQKTAISKSVEQLSPTLCNSVAFMNDLVAFGCISSDDRQSVVNKKDDHEKCQKFMAIVTENTGKMRVFKKCLVNHGHKETADMLPQFNALHLSLHVKIQHYMPLLRYVLEPRFGFRKQLCERKIMTTSEVYVDYLRSGICSHSVYDQNDHLLESLLRKSEDDCNKFLQLMSETHQQHLVNVINGTEENKDYVEHQRPLGYAELNMLIGASRQQLINNIHPSIGLIDLLYESGCITYEQKEKVSGAHSFPHKNALLLDILSRRSLSHFEEFIKCLKKTEENHEVAKLFSELGRRTVERQLSADELLKCVVHSRQLLIGTINPSAGFLDKLEESKCITYKQKQMVNAANSKPDSNDMLLDLMSHWSVDDFKAFVTCLENTEQTKAAELFTEVLSKL